MTTPVLIVGLALAVALLTGGAVTAFTSSNLLKKTIALAVSLIAAALALAVLGVPGVAVLSATAIALAYVVVGVAITVRVQEAYGSAEIANIDAADEQDEPREPVT